MSTGLGVAANWPVPYWQIDTAFATMLLLLAAADAGLGALFFGVFRNAERLLDVLGTPCRPRTHRRGRARTAA